LEDVSTELRLLSLVLATEGVLLSAELKFETNIDEERLVVTTPINSKRNQWSYAQKAYNWQATGNVDFQMNSYEILDSQSHVAYKWERGIWNYHTFWLWASAQGFAEDGITRYHSKIILNTTDSDSTSEEDSRMPRRAKPRKKR
jgi:uncharacterized protein YaiE (UPF0345 family)